MQDIDQEAKDLADFTADVLTNHPGIKAPDDAELTKLFEHLEPPDITQALADNLNEYLEAFPKTTRRKELIKNNTQANAVNQFITALVENKETLYIHGYALARPLRFGELPAQENVKLKHDEALTRSSKLLAKLGDIVYMETKQAHPSMVIDLDYRS